MLVRVQACPYGPRLYVLGRRVHHWHWGCAFVAIGVRWVWQDRLDIPLARRRVT